MVGVVVVNKFCKPGDKSGVFRGYIDYIDREEATRNKNTDRYNLFQNYMGNPEKTHALFTKTKDNLTAEEKEVLKDAFSQAYDNGSLLWQTVVSFDNQWLEQNGLYNRTTHILDEPKLNEITRLAVSKMLEKENMEHALWSAAIHHNTDNIHIHIAITEITPMREKKEFTEYKFVKEKEKYVNEKGYEDFRIVKKKVPVLDEKGNPQTYTEYRGKFQQSSLAVLKRTYVNEITQTSNTTQTNTTTQTNKGCEHNWVTNYKTESWAAEYGTRKVVDREAYTEDVPVYDMKEINVCNVCKQEITGDPSAHAQAHALAGEGAGHHTEWEKKQVGTKQVQHAEVSHQEPYLIKEAGSRQVADGQKCTKCGAVRR